MSTRSKAKEREPEHASGSHVAHGAQATKEDDAAKVLTKSSQEVATPDPKPEESITQLTQKDMEDMETKILASVESKVNSVNDLMSAKLDSMIEHLMNVVVRNQADTSKAETKKVKLEEEKIQGATGNESVKALDASALGWAADHQTRSDAIEGRDGDQEEQTMGSRIPQRQPSENPSDSDTMSGSHWDKEESRVHRRTGKSGSGSSGSVSNNRQRRNPDSDPSDYSSDDSSDGDSSDGSHRSYGKRNRQRKNSKSSRSRKNRRCRYESRSSVRKIVKDEFRSTVENIGDPKFALYKKNWAAMARDYRIRERHLVRFMNHLFDGDVLLVYQNVREENPDASSLEVWKLMSVVCYNSNHQAAVRDKVFRPKYDSKTQSVEDYGNAIKTAALALGYRIPERQLIDQFEHGLPPNLEKHATGLSGTFDEVVAMTAKYERACKRGNESFRVVGEGGSSSAYPGYLTINGRRVRRRPGVLCYRRGCDVNGGKDHFSRDHREPTAAQAKDEKATESGNGRDAATGQTASQASH